MEIMNQTGLQMRYINGQCYEFILPNGKHLITDPYVTPTKGLSNAGFRAFSVEEIERADYILITHSHFDHTSDLGYLAKKFGSMVFAGSMTIALMAEFFDLDYGKLFPVSEMQTFELEDFTLTCYKGKHFATKPMLRERSMKITQKKFGVEGYGEIDTLGVVETFDFCITFSNNLRLQFVSGDSVLNNPYTVAQSFRPNILIRHSMGGWDPTYYASLIAKFHAQVAFPMHHDNILAGKYSRTMDEFSSGVEQALYDIGSNTRFVNPEPYRWYTLSMQLVI